ncbi:MAG: N-acetylmuramoyl-L-alanine amidase [Candidatus Acidiferrum sp.]|jgi:N-acetylmuramoyl-L-alanine amidase
MNWGAKNFHKSFAVVSLGFGLGLVMAGLIPFPARANTTTSNSAIKAASSQFARAEELRGLLNSKPPDSRTLSEYKKVVAGYQRVYMITPHAAEVPDALFAVGELNTEMGDRFGRSYYQTAADTYAYLLHDYPSSKHVQDAMLRLANLQKDQLGDLAAATKTYQDFSKKFPHSTHKREVQEGLAELALRRGAETGEVAAKSSSGSGNAATPTAKAEGAATNATVAAAAALSVDNSRKTLSGGEAAKTVAVPRVQKIRTNVTADSTEVIIDLEDSVLYSAGRIANPDRIYFDLHAAKLSPAVEHADFRVSGGMLTKVRAAQYQAGVVRVVLDVDGVRDYAVSLTKRPTRLVIELYPAANRGNANETETARKNKSADSATVEEATVAPAPASSKQQADDTIAVKEAPPATPATKTLPEPSKTSLTRSSKNRPDLVQPVAAPMPTRDGQSTLTRALGLKISRIVIDAGHGGHDTGTIGPTGLMEKDLCLDVALRLGKLIEQKLPGADVVYTRSDDTFIPLEERTHIANDAKADLFVSIHANSSPDHGARGVETYYLNMKGSPEAMEVAARENAVSQEGIHDLEDLVMKIARTEKIDESKELAEDVQDSLSKRIQKTAKPVRNRGVRKAPFVVLIGADMPSILTEISFLSNPADEQLLKKPEHRQHIAEGVFQGVSAYLESMNSMAIDSAAQPKRTPVMPAVEQSRNQK